MFKASDNYRYTLIELIVTIAVIAILTSLLMSALKLVNKRTVDITCKDNLRQIGTGGLDAIIENNYKYRSNGDGKNWPWMTFIAPYVGIELSDDNRYRNGELDMFTCPHPDVYPGKDEKLNNGWKKYGAAQWKYTSELFRFMPENPAETFMYADTVRLHKKGQFMQCFRFMSRFHDSFSQIHLRHFDKSNAFFADGRVDQFDFDEMMQRKLYGFAEDYTRIRPPK